MTESNVFDKMRNEIVTNAEEKAKNILNQANQMVTDIKEDAKIRAEQISKKIITQTKKEAEVKLRREIAKTKLTSRMNLLESKEEIINNAFDKAWETIKELVNSTKYANHLNDLIVEAACGLGGGDLKVKIPTGHGKHINAQQLQQVVTKSTDTPTTLDVIEEDLRSIGGAIISNADETILIDNTFEARLRRMKEDTRTKIGNILFTE